MLWLLVGISSIQAQQYSYSSGSDFFDAQFQVHVSIGQVFGSVEVPNRLLATGVLSVLSELLDLEKKSSLDNSIQISPNPFSTEFKIAAQMDPWIAGQVEIYTNQGILVDTFQMSESTCKIALGYIPSGVYLVRIRVLGHVDYVQKIIKMN
jgi:hypothetical protein